ncbi:MAG: glycoside hydrolase [Chloroflexota bacterium]|nr:glycoside hydrolase [Chloroflexota bacterium]
MKRLLTPSSAIVSVAITVLFASSVAANDFQTVRVSAESPFAQGCNGEPPRDATLYRNAEVEPYVAVDPRNQAHLVGVWQQDRWSNGGANGLLTGVSRDGGKTWTRTFAHFSRCTGGNHRNRGDYARTTDPWVTFAPDGTVHQIALSFNDSNGKQAILASRSRDGGSTWSEPAQLTRDTDFDVGLDKQSITADPHDSRFVYAVWDRLVGLTNDDPARFFGPIWFSRTTNGGTSWEKARMIFDPGANAQTIGSIIVVLPNGDLLNTFTLVRDAYGASPLYVAVMRSHDRGVSWSEPTIVDSLRTVFVTDPQDGHPVRTGDILPAIAVNPSSGAVYLVWQDSRFNGGARDQIAFSRSNNGGRTWSPPKRINKVPGTQAFTASINVTRDGTIGVTYYDFRSDTPTAATLLTSYWMVTSQDGGDSWTESRIARPFDMRTAPDAGGFFVGDYEGLSASLVPFFGTANSGSAANRTDIFAGLSAESDEQGNQGGQVSNTTQQSVRQRIKAHREVHPDR